MNNDTTPIEARRALVQRGLITSAEDAWNDIIKRAEPRWLIGDHSLPPLL
jgi:hypothetical protein